MAKHLHGLTVQGYLREIVDVDRLQAVVDKFAKATNLAAVVTDVDGVPITNPSNFSEHCRIVRASKSGKQGCFQSDGKVGSMAAKERSLSLHRCHCGLVDMAAPLIIDNVYWGAVLCGQVLLKPPTARDVSYTLNKAKEIEVDSDCLVRALHQIDVVTETSFRANGELLQIVANYIVEMHVSQIAQKDLTVQLREKVRMERVMHQLELRALQSQVNPHFLFNTLNTAGRLAMIEGATQTEDVIFALSDLLRYTLRNIDKVVPLEEEIDYIRNYLCIQKIRFQNHIDVEYNTDSGCLDALIPLMTLQPLVENAVVHGLEAKENGGKITISTHCTDGRVCIEIKDTGIGMDTGLIDLKKEIRQSGKGHTTGLGLISAHQRIQHFLGPSYGLEIESELGEGTNVKVWIPMKERAQYA